MRRLPGGDMLVKLGLALLVLWLLGGVGLVPLGSLRHAFLLVGLLVLLLAFARARDEQMRRTHGRSDKA